MPYSYEFKRKCVELYRRGIWAGTPEGVQTDSFRYRIWHWAKIEAECGPEALMYKRHNREWTAEERYELVAQVLAGKSYKGVAISNGISESLLYRWVRKYKTLGYNGLVDKKKSKSNEEPKMKKSITTARLTESEREELIRLRAENEYIKAEIEVIKKRIALREEREAARLKAKKQRLSKNSATKDCN